MNGKKLFRLYSEEGLSVRRRRGRKRATGTRAPMAIPQAPNQRWSLDFVSDVLSWGRRFRVLAVVDDFTREALALVVGSSIGRFNACMAEPLVIQILKEKRAEILGRVAAYEAQIAAAKHDLAHVNATIRLFTEPEKQRARYMVSHGFFMKGKIADICVRHLEVDGELTTRGLAERVMVERKLDASDTTLRNSVVFKVVQALRHASRRKLVRMVEKRKGMCVWAAGEAVTLRVVANSPSTPG